MLVIVMLPGQIAVIAKTGSHPDVGWNWLHPATAEPALVELMALLAEFRAGDGDEVFPVPVDPPLRGLVAYADDESQHDPNEPVNVIMPGHAGLIAVRGPIVLARRGYPPEHDEGFTAEEARRLSTWIEGGMRGAPPKLLPSRRNPARRTRA